MKSVLRKIGPFLAVASIVVGYNVYMARRNSSVAADGFGLAAQADHLPLFAGCRNPHRGTFELTSHAVVPIDFVTSVESEERLTAAARQQLKYLTGYTNSDESARPLRVHLLEKSEVSVLGAREVPYGRSLEFRPFREEGPEMYPERFRQRRRLREQSRAVEIHFIAKQEAIVCDPLEAFANEMTFKLPRDPYLAYWYVGESDHRKLSFGPSRSVTNPCADAEMADLRWPSMYWYVWNPDAKGRDADGVSYDCRELLKPKRDYTVVKAKFVERKEMPLDFELKDLNDRAVIRGSYIYGFMNSDHKPERIEALRRLLPVETELLPLIRSLNFKSLPEDKDIDPGVWAALFFAHGLDRAAKIKTIRAETRPSAVVLRIEGLLPASGKEFRFKVFVGPTDEPQHKAFHWRFLSEALAQDEIVFYIGHSGMGANMDLKRALGSSDRRSFAAKSSRYQLLGILGCYSTQYFGDDYFSLRRGGDFVSDLMLVASRRYLVDFPAAFIGFLDAKLAGKAVLLNRFFESQIANGEMVYFDRQSAKSSSAVGFAGP